LEKHLHIVSLDVPFPADYGGMIDIFYTIKALHQQGIKIHLHCFTKGRKPSDELNKYCVEVNYYERKTNFLGFVFQLPYIVSSRRSHKLLAALQKDNYPILLEGIHCTFFLQNNKLHDRKIAVRLHNVEFEYYDNLAKNELQNRRKLFFLRESNMLKAYEKKIADKAFIIALSKQDIKVYQELFEAKQINFLPAFIPYNLISSKKGTGNYCLYHGNLSVNENEQAVLWLVDNVFNDLSMPFIIAGKDPSEKLQEIVKKYPRVSLVANPSDNKMQELIVDAQINVLPSFNKTGVKLKLLNALFNGRYCLANKAAVEGSGTEHFCTIAATAAEFKTYISYLFEQDFGYLELQQRQNLLKYYNNELSAQQLISWIY
jgi:glycosyltransferase involved in cell wall biosynthesis